MKPDPAFQPIWFFYQNNVNIQSPFAKSLGSEYLQNNYVLNKSFLNEQFNGMPLGHFLPYDKRRPNK